MCCLLQAAGPQIPSAQHIKVSPQPEPCACSANALAHTGQVFKLFCLHNIFHVLLFALVCLGFVPAACSLQHVNALAHTA